VARIIIVNTDDKIVEMLATEIGNKIAQTDDSSAQRGNGLGHSHAHSVDASDGVASTRHAERSADQLADHTAGPWTCWPPHAPTVHDVQRAMQDRYTCAHSNYRYDNESAISIIKSDILQQCATATENTSGKCTEDKPQAYTTSTAQEQAAHVISAEDTAPPATADDDRHVRGRHAHTGQDDSQTADANYAEDRTTANTDCGDDLIVAHNLQTQQQDSELANIIKYLQHGDLQ